MSVLGDIGGGVGGTLGGIAALFASGDGGEAQRQQIVDLWERIQTPEFNMSELTAPELQVVAEYFPEYYDAVLPQSLAQTQDSPETRRALGQNLEYFERVRQEGLPLSERLAAQDAQRSISAQNQSNLQSGLESLQRRGRAGGGAEAAMRLGAGQQSAELSRALGADLTQQSIDNRYRAAQDVGGYGGALRSQDIGLSGQQSSEMNRFNELISGMLTQQAQTNAANTQAAQWANTGEAQRVGDTNAMNQYGVGLENLNRQNTLGQQGFNNQLAVAQGQTGALQGQAIGLDAQQAANRDNMVGLGRSLGQTAGGAAGLAAGMPAAPKDWSGAPSITPAPTFAEREMLYPPNGPRRY